MTSDSWGNQYLRQMREITAGIPESVAKVLYTPGALNTFFFLTMWAGFTPRRACESILRFGPVEKDVEKE